MQGERMAAPEMRHSPGKARRLTFGADKGVHSAEDRGNVGWARTVGGMARTLQRGLDRARAGVTAIMAACNQVAETPRGLTNGATSHPNSLPGTTGRQTVTTGPAVSTTDFCSTPIGENAP